MGVQIMDWDEYSEDLELMQEEANIFYHKELSEEEQEKERYYCCRFGCSNCLE